MSGINVRNIDPGVKEYLRVRAARNGRSMEQEVREILSTLARSDQATGGGLASEIHRAFRKVGGVEFPAVDRGIPKRTKLG